MTFSKLDSTELKSINHNYFNNVAISSQSPLETASINYFYLSHNTLMSSAVAHWNTVERCAELCLNGYDSAQKSIAQHSIA